MKARARRNPGFLLKWNLKPVLSLSLFHQHHHLRLSRCCFIRRSYFIRTIKPINAGTSCTNADRHSLLDER